MTWELLSVLVQVFCTLAIFSFLYKDNPIYKFSEHLFVGVATGWWIVLEFRDVILPNLYEPLKAGYAGHGADRWFLLHIPLLLGLLLFMRLAPKASYLARWSMAVIVGTYAGLAVKGFTAGDLFNQIRSNIVPFFADGTLANLANDVSLETVLEVLRNPVMIIGTIAVLVYFFFSVPHKGVVGGISKVGIWFLMVSFGASYGNTVMARISLFIGRAQFLLDERTLVERQGADPAVWEHYQITLVFALMMILALFLWNRFVSEEEPAA